MKISLPHGVVAVILEKVIKKKLGYNLDLRIDKLEVSSSEGYLDLQTSVWVRMNEDDLQRLILSNLD